MPNHDFTTGVDTAIAARIVKQFMTSVRQFPKPTDPEELASLVTQWRDALNYPPKKYRPFVYEEAVTSWLANATSTSWPPMPRDVLDHCEKVMERIYDDPRRRPEMQEWAEARRMARIAWLVGEENA